MQDYPINNPAALNFTPMSLEEREAILSQLNPGVTRTDYTALMEKILREGQWVYNERTGKRCLVIISHTLRYDVDQNRLPLDTTRASSPKMAIMEKVGYWRGYDLSLIHI